VPSVGPYPNPSESPTSTWLRGPAGILSPRPPPPLRARHAARTRPIARLASVLIVDSPSFAWADPATLEPEARRGATEHEENTMKLRLSMAMMVATMVATGCGKKDDAAPAPAQVAAPQAATPSAKPEPTPTATTPEAVAAAPAAPAAEGCGGHEHAAAGAAGHDHNKADHACAEGAADADCPFKGESGVHVAEHAKPAEEAMGCGGKPLVEAAATAGGGIHFGSTFAVTEASPLGKVAATATDGQELTVRVTGTIDKVCQKKGCWMVVKDGDFQARVIMKDASFTVPLDSTGKPAQVEGTLKVKVFTEAQAKHLAEDGGQDPSTVTGEKKEFLLTATAVEIGG
jgi:hypothetical protein